MKEIDRQVGKRHQHPDGAIEIGRPEQGGGQGKEIGADKEGEDADGVAERVADVKGHRERRMASGTSSETKILAPIGPSVTSPGQEAALVQPVRSRTDRAIRRH